MALDVKAAKRRLLVMGLINTVAVLAACAGATPTAANASAKAPPLIRLINRLCADIQPPES